jgi:poly(A) polymerase
MMRTMTPKEEKALAILRRLRDNGFIALFNGGCVRDRILGLPVKDYDIATDARPEVVQRLFDETVPVGAKFGVIMVILDGDPFELATFRADAPYVDGRRPSSVRFGTLEEDAKRRDFTIGGMYYDPFADRLIDTVGGMRDLRAGIIRAIGNPYDRFAEDHLRVIRAARFAARLNFVIEPETHRAMKLTAPMLPKISAERIGEEIVRMMTEGGAARGMDIMVETGIMKEVLPEVLPMIGCQQPANYHPEGDVYVHTKIAVAMLSPGCSETLAFGILFHDVAKPNTRAEQNGKVTYYGHTEIGAEMAAAILARLRRSRAVQERVAYLVKNHLKLTMAPRMRASTLRRMLAEDGFDELLEVSRMDALASSSFLGHYHFCRRAMKEITPARMRPPRFLNGRDLIGMGFTPGPAFKNILKEVEDLQLDGEIADRDAALAYVREHYSAAGN